MPYSPMQLAEAFIKAGELPDALDALAAHLAEHPDDEHAKRLQVAVWLRTDDPAHTLAARDTLRTLTRTSSDEYTLSVVLEQTEPTLDPALQAVSRAYALAHDKATKDRALERQLHLLRKLGQLEAALNLALERDWIQWAADATADLNDDRRALGYYHQALERIEGLYRITSPEIATNIKGRVLLKRAAVHVRLGDYADAIADYDAAAQAIPNDPTIPLHRAVAAWHRAPDNQTARDAVRATYHALSDGLRGLIRDEWADDPALLALVE